MGTGAHSAGDGNGGSAQCGPAPVWCPVQRLLSLACVAGLAHRASPAPPCWHQWARGQEGSEAEPWCPASRAGLQVGFTFSGRRQGGQGMLGAVT